MPKSAGLVRSFRMTKGKGFRLKDVDPQDTLDVGSKQAAGEDLRRSSQKKRFLRRLDDPEKNWKFSAGDVEERQHWDAYMEA